jgi:hypothetical protein
MRWEWKPIKKNVILKSDDYGSHVYLCISWIFYLTSTPENDVQCKLILLLEVTVRLRCAPVP